MGPKATIHRVQMSNATLAEDSTMATAMKISEENLDLKSSYTL
jgi:hypothetical protein